MRKSAATSPQLQAVTISSCARLATGKILVEHPKVNLKGGKAYTVYVVGSRADRAGLQVLIPLEGVTYLDFGK